jgi:hypothetical protein
MMIVLTNTNINYMLKFEEYDLTENVMSHGYIGDKFYIILKGVVSIHILNPAIKDRIHNRRKHPAQ